MEKSSHLYNKETYIKLILLFNISSKDISSLNTKVKSNDNYTHYNFIISEKKL